MIFLLYILPLWFLEKDTLTPTERKTSETKPTEMEHVHQSTYFALDFRPRLGSQYVPIFEILEITMKSDTKQQANANYICCVTVCSSFHTAGSGTSQHPMVSAPRFVRASRLDMLTLGRDLLSGLTIIRHCTPSVPVPYIIDVDICCIPGEDRI